MMTQCLLWEAYLHHLCEHNNSGSIPPPDSRPGNDNSFSARAKARRGVADDGINISENFASASDPPKFKTSQCSYSTTSC